MFSHCVYRVLDHDFGPGWHPEFEAKMPDGTLIGEAAVGGMLAQPWTDLHTDLALCYSWEGLAMPARRPGRGAVGLVKEALMTAPMDCRSVI